MCVLFVFLFFVCFVFPVFRRRQWLKAQIFYPWTPWSQVRLASQTNRVSIANLPANQPIRQPARQAVLDVDSGVIDAAVIWGPIASYHARDAKNEIVLVPLVNENSGVRLNFRVSMAVRYNETDWKHKVNEVLKKLEPQIRVILEDYGVPLLDERGNLLSD